MGNPTLSGCTISHLGTIVIGAWRVVFVTPQIVFEGEAPRKMVSLHFLTISQALRVGASLLVVEKEEKKRRGE